MENKFFICEHCGNLVGLISGGNAPLYCCGSEMKELQAGSVEASREKHIPVVSLDGNLVKVEVGSVLHPMAEEHNIAWVYLKTDKGGHRKNLEVGKSPIVVFALVDEKPIEVYAYCNLHGLWKTQV